MSPRPEDEAQAEILANVTTRGGKELTGYAATPIDKAWGWSLTGDYDHQRVQDIDDDGWADLPRVDSQNIGRDSHPELINLPLRQRPIGHL